MNKIIFLCLFMSLTISINAQSNKVVYQSYFIENILAKDGFVDGCLPIMITITSEKVQINAYKYGYKYSIFERKDGGFTFKYHYYQLENKTDLIISDYAEIKHEDKFYYRINYGTKVYLGIKN